MAAGGHVQRADAVPRRQERLRGLGCSERRLGRPLLRAPPLHATLVHMHVDLRGMRLNWLCAL